MKICHVPTHFFPDPAGGTEVYAASLARHLSYHNFTNVIVAPGKKSESYVYDGIAVRRFAGTTGPLDLNDLYGQGDRQAAAEFASLLDEECPDIVHFHTLAPLRLLHKVQQRHIPSVFTYHLPMSCARGTLMRWGKEVCDGQLLTHRCAGCALHSHGLNRFASTVVGGLPREVGRAVNAVGLDGGVWTALRMSDLMQSQHTAIREFVTGIDRVVALCEWSRQVLINIGVSMERISLSRHGLPSNLTASCLDNARLVVKNTPLRVAFLGRLVPAKGLHVLLEAMRTISAPIELDLYTIVDNAAIGPYQQTVLAAAKMDSRVSILSPVPNDHVVSLLRAYDLLAVPSQWLETGPLVVLEAFAAGIPVIGSDLGGIAELVHNEIDGLLVPPEGVLDWGRALTSLASDRALLNQLRAGVRPPRTMTCVAAEMATLYHSISTARSI